jgi:DNA polymerase I-like protein with 3'-5' exonuclease and polymerase domains
MALTIFSPTFDPMTKDILRRAKEASGIKTRIRLETDLNRAKKSPNLITLGNFTELPNAIPTLTPAQLKAKPSALSTISWTLRNWRAQSSLPRLRLAQPGTPRSRTRSTSPETRTFEVFRSRHQVVSWLRTSRGAQHKPRLALDIETHGDVDVLHPEERPLVCVGLYDGEGVGIIPRSLLGPESYEGKDNPWPEFLYELSNWDLELHNGMFDIPTLTARLAEPGVEFESYGVEIGFDTQLAHYALRPAAEQGLKPLVKSFFNVDDWDKIESFPRMATALADGNRDWWWKNVYPVMEEIIEHKHVQWFAKASKMEMTKEFAEEYNLPEELALLATTKYFFEKEVNNGFLGKMDMKRLAHHSPLMVQLYNGYDVLYTWALRDFLMPYHEHHEDVKRASDHLHEFSNAIMWDQLGGFPIDTVKAAQMCVSLEERVAEEQATLVEWAHSYIDPALLPGRQFNPGSWQQVKKLYAHVGHKLTATDKKTMTSLAERGDKFAAKLLDWRSFKKELSTYALKARDHTNSIHGEPRLYPWYRLTTTITGRLSSSGVTNIQNWSKQEDRPHEDRLRSLLIPTSLRDEPSVLVQVDYSQAELRVAAALAKDQWLLDQFADESVDIFTKMTMDIFPDLTDMQEIKLWRRPLKSVVYGLAFGRQARAIALELGIAEKEAQDIIDQFLGMASNYAKLREWTMRAARNGVPLITRYGRHFQHEIVTPKNRASVERSALSFLPQSSASDTTLRAYMNLRPEAKKRGWIFRALVHDAITYDVPLSEAEECIAVVGEAMQKAGEAMFPEVRWAVDGNYATDWSRTG